MREQSRRSVSDGHLCVVLCDGRNICLALKVVGKYEMVLYSPTNDDFG